MPVFLGITWGLVKMQILIQEVPDSAFQISSQVTVGSTVHTYEQQRSSALVLKLGCTSVSSQWLRKNPDTQTNEIRISGGRETEVISRIPEIILTHRIHRIFQNGGSQECGAWTSSINITQELIKNVVFELAIDQLNHKLWTQQPILTSLPDNSEAH